MQVIVALRRGPEEGQTSFEAMHLVRSLESRAARWRIVSGDQLCQDRTIAVYPLKGYVERLKKMSKRHSGHWEDAKNHSLALEQFL